jgi:adenine deaminase
MDRVIRHAISEGVTPMVALQMATINTADHFGMSREMGQIAPGRWADILLVEDLRNFHAHTVIARGVVIARGETLMVPLEPYPYPAWAKASVHLPRSLQPGDFRISVETGAATVTAHVIGVIENQAPTRHLKLAVQPQNGEIVPDAGRDLAKIALVERHRATGQVRNALVSGFGFTTPCAVASTVAHDSHHMIVIGTSEADMALAANRLAQTGGGQVVVKGGKIIGEVQLPIAGLISDRPAHEVADGAASVLAGFEACGCRLNSPNMQMALLALVVIPELRISDLGLVDVTRFEFVPVLEP